MFSSLLLVKFSNCCGRVHLQNPYLLEKATALAAAALCLPVSAIDDPRAKRGWEAYTAVGQEVLSHSESKFSGTLRRLRKTPEGATEPKPSKSLSSVQTPPTGHHRGKRSDPQWANIIDAVTHNGNLRLLRLSYGSKTLVFAP
jgi:hypothetical protein